MVSGEHGILESGATVHIRPPQLEDCAEFIAMNNASVQFHQPWAYPPRTEDEFHAYLLRNLRDDFEALLLCRNSDSAILGAINISQIFLGNFCSAYSGYYIGAMHTGNGYMTEGMRLAMTFAHKTLRLHRLEANIQPANAPSIALVQRLGFTKEGFSPRYLKIGGEWRDHERWAAVFEA